MEKAPDRFFSTPKGAGWAELERSLVVCISCSALCLPCHQEMSAVLCLSFTWATSSHYFPLNSVFQAPWCGGMGILITACTTNIVLCPSICVSWPTGICALESQLFWKVPVAIAHRGFKSAKQEDGWFATTILAGSLDLESLTIILLRIQNILYQITSVHFCPLFPCLQGLTVTITLLS